MDVQGAQGMHVLSLSEHGVKHVQSTASPRSGNSCRREASAGCRAAGQLRAARQIFASPWGLPRNMHTVYESVKNMHRSKDKTASKGFGKCPVDIHACGLAPFFSRLRAHRCCRSLSSRGSQVFLDLTGAFLSGTAGGPMAPVLFRALRVSPWPPVFPLVVSSSARVRFNGLQGLTEWNPAPMLPAVLRLTWRKLVADEQRSQLSSQSVENTKTHKGKALRASGPSSGSASASCRAAQVKLNEL